MEPGAAAAAYAVETAVEGTVGAAIAIARPTMPLKAKFHRIPTSTPLPRSSHSLSVYKGRAYIFGGEIRPREPVNNDVHIYTLPSSGVEEADYERVAAQPDGDGGEVPPSRVGHTAAIVAGRIYIFGGRGGKEMQPLEEHGRVWVFDTDLKKWTHLDPVKDTPYPEARSYHAATANEHPLPSKDDFTMSPVGSPDVEAHGTLFIHGGCPASGRLADVWSFDIAARTWSQYPDAPGPPRGGPCLTFAKNKLYRYGGFDGKNQIGGQLDYLQITLATFDDMSGKGELSVSPRGNWETILFAKDMPTPGNRSVAGFHFITTGQGRNFLLLILGEKDASSKGHEGAGNFHNDVWSYQLQPEGMTAASFKDATRQLLGAKTGEGEWAQVEIPEATMSDGKLQRPGGIGWFASAQGEDMDPCSVMIWGGLNGSNERQGDGWILTIQT